MACGVTDPRSRREKCSAAGFKSIDSHSATLGINTSCEVVLVSESAPSLIQLAGTCCILISWCNMTDSWLGRQPGTNPTPSLPLVCVCVCVSRLRNLPHSNSQYLCVCVCVLSHHPWTSEVCRYTAANGSNTTDKSAELRLQ